MNSEMLNIILSSPVLVAIVGVISAVLTSRAKNSLSDKEEKDIDMHDANAEKIDDIHSISKNLIVASMNSNQLAISSILESSKSTNTAVKSISNRIDLLEEKVEYLEEEKAA